jgi:hypothetical protein
MQSAKDCLLGADALLALKKKKKKKNTHTHTMKKQEQQKKGKEQQKKGKDQELREYQVNPDQTNQYLDSNHNPTSIKKLIRNDSNDWKVKWRFTWGCNNAEKSDG